MDWVPPANVAAARALAFLPLPLPLPLPLTALEDCPAAVGLQPFVEISQILNCLFILCIKQFGIYLQFDSFHSSSFQFFLQ